jgi:hypothetical protein
MDINKICRLSFYIWSVLLYKALNEDEVYPMRGPLLMFFSRGDVLSDCCPLILVLNLNICIPSAFLSNSRSRSIHRDYE